MSPEGHVVSSTPGAFRLRWDVFLSFRGADTRDCLTKPLYYALESRGVRVFLDDVGLDRGDLIAPSLLEAIDESAASIIIISPDYASSHWCLEELAKICDCGRLILPVFYDVSPIDVLEQTGPFEDSFKVHKVKRSEDEVIRWRKAMKKVGGIAGWIFQKPSQEEHLIRSQKREDHLIRLLIQRIMKELSNTSVGLAEFTVGLNARIEELLKLLHMKSNGVRLLGLFGMGGVGKTTLVKALFNRLIVHFEHRSFISSVRQVSSEDGGLIALRNRIISDISSQVVVDDDISAFRRTVNEHRALIILDDVDDAKQLDAIIGKREWFHEGSRIVVTSRDTRALPETCVDVLYEVQILDDSESLELFCYHALRRKEPGDKNLFNLSKEIVSLTGRLPLALEVFGSLLFGKIKQEEWVDAVEKLKVIRPGNLQEVLKISYEGLDEQEKCIFLDIACLFVQMRMKRGDVIDVLRGCTYGGERAITVLSEKCLIKIREDETIWMHDQIRDMGRQIVVEENLVDPSMRSRLWDRSEILAVLRNLKGTRCIQGMVLDFEKRSSKDNGEAISWNNLKCGSSLANALAFLKQIHKKYFQRVEKDKEVPVLKTKSFETMVNLVLLQINNLRLEGKFEYFPAELKWLQWQGCPLKCMPSDFWPQELAVLDLTRSYIENLWSRKGNKVPQNLMFMNLSDCYHLEALPDLSGCGRLEKIVLVNCIKLSRIPESVGNLITLRHLNMAHCRELTELPNDVSGLKKLESLSLSDCCKLKSLPRNMANLKSLRKLLANGTALTELPKTFFRLEKLEILILNDCQNLKRLPDNFGLLCSLQELSLNQSGLEELPNSVGRLKNLEKLGLKHCYSLTEIPDSIGNLDSLTELMLSGSAIRDLPSSIGSLSYLNELYVGYCKSLKKLPESIKLLASIVELQLDGTAITVLPDEIGDMKLLKKLEMRNSQMRSLPESIGHLAALTSMDISNGSIEELPESIRELKNLVHLRLDKCRMLRKLPDSLGCLKSLYHLGMEETGLTELPQSFGLLTSLRTLKMANKSENNLLHDSSVISSFFCNMIFLNDLDARCWKISGKIPDAFVNLSSLETLNLSQNKFHSLPSSLAGLSILKNLSLQNCIELVSLPALPSSLTKLNAADCCNLQSTHELSNLTNLQNLNFTNCVKLVDIPGLERLGSLRELFFGGCIACSSTIRKRFSEVMMRNLRNLSMPGTRLPKWFSGQAVSFSKPKNRELTGAIIGIILSINHDDTPSELHGQLPGAVDIKANVLKLGETIYSITLDLRGLPRTNEEQIYLFRFPDYHELISYLRNGGKFCVTKKNPLVDKRLELKKCGVHLMFEGDDDYDDDDGDHEESVSEKLAKFFNTYEEEDSP